MRRPSLNRLRDDASMLRAAWLMAATEELRPVFKRHGYAVPVKLRHSIGFPKGGIGTDAIGMYFNPEMVSDGYGEILVSPILEDPVRLIDVLAHEIVHACMPRGEGHGRAFKQCALAIGLMGPMRATTASPEFAQWVNTKVIPRIGKYPAGSIRRIERKQGTRLIKCMCETCGYAARVTRLWIDQAGAPLCPTHKKTAMLVVDHTNPSVREAA